MGKVGDTVAAAARVLELLHIVAAGNDDVAADLIDRRPVVSKLGRTGDQQLAKPLLTGKIAVKNADHFVHCQQFFLKYGIVERFDGISKACRTAEEHAGIIVVSAALLHALSPVDAIVHDERGEDHRHLDGVEGNDVIVSADQRVPHVLELRDHCVHNVLLLGEAARIAGLDAGHFAGNGIQTVM